MKIKLFATDVLSGTRILTNSLTKIAPRLVSQLRIYIPPIKEIANIKGNFARRNNLSEQLKNFDNENSDQNPRVKGQPHQKNNSNVQSQSQGPGSTKADAYHLLPYLMKFNPGLAEKLFDTNGGQKKIPARLDELGFALTDKTSFRQFLTSNCLASNSLQTALALTSPDELDQRRLKTTLQKLESILPDGSSVEERAAFISLNQRLKRVFPNNTVRLQYLCNRKEDSWVKELNRYEHILSDDIEKRSGIFKQALFKETAEVIFPFLIAMAAQETSTSMKDLPTKRIFDRFVDEMKKVTDGPAIDRFIRHIANVRLYCFAAEGNSFEKAMAKWSESSLENNKAKSGSESSSLGSTEIDREHIFEQTKLFYASLIQSGNTKALSDWYNQYQSMLEPLVFEMQKWSKQAEKLQAGKHVFLYAHNGSSDEAHKVWHHRIKPRGDKENDKGWVR
jgi:hypothetical protein